MRRDHPHPSVAVGTFLAKKGFVLADEAGVPFDGPVETSTLGILTSEYFTPQKAHHFLFWSFGKAQPPRRILLGVFRFDTDTHATFEIYGRDNMESMMLLAHRIEILFRIKMSARLSKDRTVFERLPEDIEV